jgi:hypothetical protein
MQKYESIEKGIMENDVESLRESVGSICYTCRDFSNGEFDEVVAYVMSKGIKLLDDALVGTLVSAGKDSYTDADFARAVFELKRNFCKERIENVKRIGIALYRKQENNEIPPAQENDARPKEQRHQAEMIKMGLVAIGLAVLVIAAVLVILLVK